MQCGYLLTLFLTFIAIKFDCSSRFKFKFKGLLNDSILSFLFDDYFAGTSTELWVELFWVVLIIFFDQFSIRSELVCFNFLFRWFYKIKLNKLLFFLSLASLKHSFRVLNSKLWTAGNDPDSQEVSVWILKILRTRIIIKSLSAVNRYHNRSIAGFWWTVSKFWWGEYIPTAISINANRYQWFHESWY